jgi:hypothetical protein
MEIHHERLTYTSEPVFSKDALMEGIMEHKLGHGDCPACQEEGARLTLELARARNELQFMASTEKGKLRAINAKLLAALEAIVPTAANISVATIAERLNVSEIIVAKARDAIEEARK